MIYIIINLCNFHRNFTHAFRFPFLQEKPLMSKLRIAHQRSKTAMNYADYPHIYYSYSFISMYIILNSWDHSIFSFRSGATTGGRRHIYYFYQVFLLPQPVLVSSLLIFDLVCCWLFSAAAMCSSYSVESGKLQSSSGFCSSILEKVSR